MLEGKIGKGPFFRVQSDELTVCLVEIGSTVLPPRLRQAWHSKGLVLDPFLPEKVHSFVLAFRTYADIA